MASPLTPDSGTGHGSALVETPSDTPIGRSRGKFSGPGSPAWLVSLGFQDSYSPTFLLPR